MSVMREIRVIEGRLQRDLETENNGGQAQRQQRHENVSIHLKQAPDVMASITAIASNRKNTKSKASNAAYINTRPAGVFVVHARCSVMLRNHGSGTHVRIQIPADTESWS